MKYFFTTILLAFGMLLNAQTWTPIYNNQKIDGVWANKYLRFPTDTSTNKTGVVMVANKFWIGNGTKWSTVSSDTGRSTSQLVTGGSLKKTNDSLGTIISIGLSTKQNATFVNVKDFGALGDSTTNDYTAINNAIAYAVSSGLYWVHFPNGKYLVSGTITVPSFIRITGESIRRPIIFGNFSGTLLNLSGEGISINEILLDQSGALAGSTGRTGNAIDLIGTNSVNTSWTQITSVEAISNNKALNIDASTSSTQRGDIAITNCAFFHSGASDTGVVVKNTRYVAILNSSLFSTGSSTGCRLYSDANSPYLKVTSNAVTGQIDINGQSTSFSNVNFGGAVNLNAKNATVSGGSTSGNFTINGDSSIVIVALIGTATITDNGVGNSIYSRYSKTKKIGVGKDATQAVDVLVSAGTNDGVLVTNSNTYNNWLGVNSSNVGFIGSTNGTPVQIQTNGIAAINITTSQIVGTTSRLNVNGATDNSSYQLNVNGNALATTFVKSGGTSSQYLMADGSVTTGIGNTQAISSIKTSAYTITSTDYHVLVDGSGGAFTVTLPTAVGITGRIYIITRTDVGNSGGSVTLAANGSETIGGYPTFAFGNQTFQYCLGVQSDGTNWQIISR